MLSATHEPFVLIVLLNVVMLSVIMLSVVAPFNWYLALLYKR
jgi:hypothetical protein